MTKIVAKVTKVYRKIEKANKKFIISCGGSGSSKSYSLSQYFIFKKLERFKEYHLAIIRKTLASNKKSIYKDFINILKKNNIYDIKNHNRSDYIYTFSPFCQVSFLGLDNIEKLKSTEYHDIWLEEANEFTVDDFRFLKTRLYRGSLPSYIDMPRIYMSFNPVECWIFDLENHKDVEWINSNYKDNYFCNEEYKKTLEEFKNEDMILYNIYTLGMRGQIKDLIYPPYTIIPKFPDSFDETIYGVDFGYTNPSVLLQLNIKDSRNVYLRELIYQTHLLNNEFIKLIKEAIPYEHLVRGYPIYCDSAEPDRIIEMQQAGLNAIPAYKGLVKDGIDFCKRFVYYSLGDNININKENKRYKWKKNKLGEFIDEPVKVFDHGMACKRYALYTHLKDILGKTIKEYLKVKEQNFNANHILNEKW
jgi:phage terminase large subunit